MPSFIGHSIIGLCIYAIVNKNLNFKKNWREMLLYVFLANLSDIDVIPQLFGFSIPFIVHRQILHSIAFAFILAIILSYYLQLKAVPSRNQVPKFFIILILIFSHPLADLFTLDNRPPPGVMILWPFSSSHYILPWHPLPGISHNNLLELFKPINFNPYINELKIFGALFILVYLYLLLVLKPDIEPGEKGVKL